MPICGDDIAMSDEKYAPALGRLRQTLADIKKSDNWNKIVEPKDRVIARFQPLLNADHLPHLTEEEIRPFFYFEHNRHWTSLYRQVNRVCGDMAAFRKALALLVDEKRPIEARLNMIAGSNSGLGKAILSGLLIVAFPEKYGVWNGTSEAGLIALELLPTFDRGESFGARYARINAVLTRLASDLAIDLWTLDALWWHLLSTELSEERLEGGQVTSSVSMGDAQFGLERHLHDFLYDNWDKTSLAKEWQVYSEPGDPEKGYEFQCSVGRIDLLARHKNGKKWLVIELKRGNSSDVAVGQVLRYMGWVQKNLANQGENVEGLIIAKSGDEAIRYAVSAAPNLRFLTYEVDFRLKDE